MAIPVSLSGGIALHTQRSVAVFVFYVCVSVWLYSITLVLGSPSYGSIAVNLCKMPFAKHDSTVCHSQRQCSEAYGFTELKHNSINKATP